MGIGRKISPSVSKTKALPSPASSPQKKDDKKEAVFVPETPKYTLKDLILPSNVYEKILDIADYAKNSKVVFEDWGLKNTHKYSRGMGINLYGPSGTGKTMAAHAIADYLGRDILIVNYADIESKYVGETPKNIRRAFEAAKASHSILFFDEADAILSRRVTNMNNATDVSVNQTRSVMLMIMNEYQDFIIFATNFIENFDPAFMRRIAIHVKFDLPDYECRKRLWEMYIPEQMPNNIDIEKLAKEYEGLSGSDISNAVLMAAFKAARHKDSVVTEECVAEKVKEILDSKKANEKNKPYPVSVTEKEVSEDYVKEQLGGKLP